MIAFPAGAEAEAYVRSARGAAAPAEPGPPRTFARAAVIGAGTMGTTIALALANAAVAVELIDPDAHQLERAGADIARAYAASVRRGRIDTAQAAERGGRIAFAAGLEAAANAEVVIEAAFEDLAVKSEIFSRLGAFVAPGALLATNTSTLDIDAIASAGGRPHDTLGLHFFNPAQVMRLLEIIPGRQTSAAALATAHALSRQLAKIGIISGNADGFIGNRMLYAYRREAEFLLEEGASPAQADRALCEFGFAMGPFAVADLAGLDIGWRVRRRQHAQAPPTGRYSRIADRLCELGRFGRKTAAGYYRYAAGDRTPLPDPFVDELIEQTARAAGIVRRPVGDDEIVRRCLYALVNEAAAILTAGIARRAGDIDLVWLYGYGFPAARGGPLYCADTIGLATVVAEMRDLAHRHGERWLPVPLLVELAAAGTPLTAAL